MNLLFALGSFFGGLAVALGAFGAHALADRLTPERLANFETGARYQMYHALALLALALAIAYFPAGTKLLTAAGWLFTLGILLFSGSLYILSLTGIRWLGAVTPLGGVAFAAGWLMMLLAAWQAK
jgi:uncharacterized membrane protein YgdD (TMEM256/DUF423 family)